MTQVPQQSRSGLAMMVVGALGLVAAVWWLLAVADPMPMFIILAGGGLVFIGAGAALRRSRS
jgi:hypothetical protein